MMMNAMNQGGKGSPQVPWVSGSFSSGLTVSISPLGIVFCLYKTKEGTKKTVFITVLRRV